MTVTWIPILPPWLIVLAVLGMLALLVHGTMDLIRKQVARSWLAALTALRLLSILLVAVCLGRPVVRHTRPVEQKPPLLILADTSASMGLNHPEGGNRLSGLLNDLQNRDLLKTLESQFEPTWFTYDRDARMGKPDPAAQQPSGAYTDLGASLSTAWLWMRQQAAHEGAETPSRVLLLTDGHGVDDPAILETARSLGAILYPVPAADSTAVEPVAPPLEIMGAQAPGRILLGSECRFRVTVRRQAGSTLPPSMLVLTENRNRVAEYPVTFRTNETEKVIQLSHRPTAAGIMEYSMFLQTGETVPDNGDAYDFTVQVVTRTTRVLLLDDAWRWDFKFLRRLLEDDPSFTFVAFLARGAGTYMQFAEPEGSTRLAGFPQSRAELDFFDLFIIGDVQVRRWPANLAPALRDLVIERGRSIIFIAGPRISQLARDPSLEPLLPVMIGGETARPVTGPVPVRVTREGRIAPAFYIPPGTETDPWEALPDLDQVYAPQRKKPAATILLECPEHSNPFGRMIAMAEHTVGRGRSLYIGTDTLWKWQLQGRMDDDENTPHHRFWSQALRAMAPVRQAAGGTRLSLQADRTRYRGVPTIRIQVSADGEPLPTGSSLDLRVETPEGQRLPLATRTDPRDPTVTLADFDVIQPGRYRITVEHFIDGRPAGDLTAVVDSEPGHDESRHVRTDRPALERLAATTGGKLVSLDDPDTWPAADRSPDRITTRIELIDPWQSFVLLLLLALVLGIDWLIRLLKGYV